MNNKIKAKIKSKKILAIASMLLIVFGQIKQLYCLAPVENGVINYGHNTYSNWYISDSAPSFSNIFFMIASVITAVFAVILVYRLLSASQRKLPMIVSIYPAFIVVQSASMLNIDVPLLFATDSGKVNLYTIVAIVSFVEVLMCIIGLVIFLKKKSKTVLWVSAAFTVSKCILMLIHNVRHYYIPRIDFLTSSGDLFDVSLLFLAFDIAAVIGTIGLSIMIMSITPSLNKIMNASTLKKVSKAKRIEAQLLDLTNNYSLGNLTKDEYETARLEILKSI